MQYKKYDRALYRITIIQQRLYDGEALNKKDLATEFNVSEKSIQRDINERLNNIPIEFLQGVGFKLKPNFVNKAKAMLFAKQSKSMETRSALNLNRLKAIDAIDEADAILISAGAGMGVDSGLPDFRGNEGFWKAYPPMKQLGLDFASMANPKWFIAKPELAWGFYGHRLNLYRNTVPHKGFDILKKMVSLKDNNYFIYTSNVDGQFQKAGFDEKKIYECHGSIHFNQCLNNCSNEVWNNEDLDIGVNLKTFTMDKHKIPKCKNCNSIARPNILMFGDYGFNATRRNAQNVRFNEWLQYNINKKLKIVVIEIGAGEYIPTVRRLSEELVAQYNATLVRINPRDYEVPNGQIFISLGGLEGLQKISSN